MTRRIFPAAPVASAVLYLLLTSGAWAQRWPTHPVTVVVPFTAGTTSDVVARAMVDHLAREFGQPFVIDNRGGAGGNIRGRNRGEGKARWPYLAARDHRPGRHKQADVQRFAV